MNIVSFNINGLRARPHQLEAVVEKYDPEIIALQETKVDDPQFPREAVEALGYHVTFFGQKGHYGVATLSKAAPTAVQYGFPSDGEDAQRRFIALSVPFGSGSLWALNGYFPRESRDPQQVPSENGVLRRSPDLPREGSRQAIR